MTISKRHDECHRLTMESYDNPNESEGFHIQKRELIISNLADAGDYLEQYMSNESDLTLIKALFAIDTKIAELRIGKTVAESLAVQFLL